MLKLPLLVGVVGIAVALTIVIASPAQTPATPEVAQQTYLGMTAAQWHASSVAWMEKAKTRAKDRAWLQQRLGVRTRELLTMHRRFKAEPDRPPHFSQWLCIHGYEATWSDPNAPYYGGLQFSHDTWERNGGHKYAPEANLATPLQQMWIAENAWHESGGSFSQWPNTARYCGLL